MIIIMVLIMVSSWAFWVSDLNSPHHCDGSFSPENRYPQGPLRSQQRSSGGGSGRHCHYYDQNNQFPYVVSLFSTSVSSSQYTSSLINSRTMTAAHWTRSRCSLQ